MRDMQLHILGDRANKKEIEALSLAVIALYNQPRWIPCSERLPETGQPVRITAEVKNDRMATRYTCNGYHVNRYEMEADNCWDAECTEYREEDDKYYVLPGWYEIIHNWPEYGSVGIDDSIIAWQPMQEPYSERSKI